MLIYPDLNPNAISFGAITIKWYGICYFIAFLLGYFLMLLKDKKQCNYFNKNIYRENNNYNGNTFNKEQITDLLLYISIGVVFGGRIGYMLFYSPSEILFNRLSLIQFWLPGRSFHGGLLGVVMAIWIYAKKNRYNFLAVTDFIAPIIPIGLGLGRIGNFINGELYGRITNVPWAMVFPHIDQLPRHPSQIYEFLLEGVILFLILNINSNCKFFNSFKLLLNNNKSALFLMFYGLFRIVVENYREPDFEYNFIANLTMGQILSIPMVIAGIIILVIRTTKNCELPHKI